MNKTIFNDIIYVSDGRIRRADITIVGDIIDHIADREELPLNADASSYQAVPASLQANAPSLQTNAPSRQTPPAPSPVSAPGGSPAGTILLLPGIIDTHVHTREPGLTHKGDLATETRAAAAGGVTSIFDMPNVVPQTTTLEALRDRQALGRDHAFVNHAFLFGATNTNAALLQQLDPTSVPAVKLFMGSSTGGMLVDHGEALRDVFRLSPLPIVAHCEDTAIINSNLKRVKAIYGDDPDVSHHPDIRSREACIASSTLAARLAIENHARLHIAHITTKEEVETLPRLSPILHNPSTTSIPNKAPSLPHHAPTSLSHSTPNIPPSLSPTRECASRFSREDSSPPSAITLEACLPHLLFTDADYPRLGSRIKCNPAVKTAADRAALRAALTDGRITTIATDHAPHLLTEKQGGCAKAASGIPMIQFSLPSMLELMEEGILTLPRLVELMCHAPARLFDIDRRGFIREGYKADLTIVSRSPWTLTPDLIQSRCRWSPLEGHTFPWQVTQTYCNGSLIFDHGSLATDNTHARPLTFARTAT